MAHSMSPRETCVRVACVRITMPFAIRRVTNYSSTYVRSRSSIWPPPNRLYLHSYVFTCAKARIEPSRNTHSNMALKPRMITQAGICTDKQHTHPLIISLTQHHSRIWRCMYVIIIWDGPLYATFISRSKINMLRCAVAAAAACVRPNSCRARMLVNPVDAPFYLST